MPADFASVATNASNNSFDAAVENDGEVMLVLELDRSVDFTTSVAIAPDAGIAARQIRRTGRLSRSKKKARLVPTAPVRDVNIAVRCSASLIPSRSLVLRP